LVRADSLSYTFPRISPDGRFLMYTETGYGQFPMDRGRAEIKPFTIRRERRESLESIFCEQ